jgi:hypothetical protein
MVAKKEMVLVMMGAMKVLMMAVLMVSMKVAMKE